MSVHCLVVGGTGFLGRAIVRALQSDGHGVTILARGRRTVPDGVRLIEGDRAGDLPPLGTFDWIFDTSAYTPQMVDGVLDRLDATPSIYALVSSLSVYGEFSEPAHENRTVPDASAEDFAHARAVPPSDIAQAGAYGSSYGPLKRSAEVRLEERMGPSALSLRVGALIGAGDYTDRFTWWVRRTDEARGDRRRVAVPGGTQRPVQVIDVADVADFAVSLAASGRGGVFNVTGPPTRFGDVLSSIARVAGTDPHFVPVPLAAATGTGLRPWTDIPLTLPDTPEFASFFEVRTDKAQRAGLNLRPLADTVTEILTWDRMRRDMPLSLGIPPATEAALIAASSAA